MDSLYKSTVIGLLVATLTAVLYYPAVAAVGLLFCFASTPPPLGPRPAEVRLKEAAFAVLAYPSRALSGPGRGSVWSPLNPLGHGLTTGIVAGFLAALAIAAARPLRSGRWPSRPGERP